MLLLTGATGMFGGRIAALLSAQGVPFRAVLRAADAGALGEHAGVEIVEGDLDDPSSLTPALDGADVMFLNAPMDDRKQARLTGAIDVARRTSRPRVVLLTGGVQHDDPLGEQGRVSQEALLGSGLEWTLVGPQTVMESNFLPQADTIKKEGSFIGCAGDGRVGMVALDDVAEAFVIALTTNGHEHQEYIITGPAAVTFTEVAEAATRVLGHTIEYQDMPEDEYRKLLLRLGVFTEKNIDIGIIWHMRAMRAGKAARVTTDFTTLTGRPSRSIDDFFTEHRDRFA